MSNTALVCIIILFSLLTVINVLSWKRSREVESDLQACIREYRILLEERPCPAE